jgi:transposase-like protein
MPQLQLPIFPEGVTHLTKEIAFQRKDGVVTYFYGHLPVFQHNKDDLESFRLFTSQLVINGSVRQADIVRAFAVPRVTVKRYVKLIRQQGAKGFFVPPRQRSASVLKGEVAVRAQTLFDAGKSVPEVARELDVLPNTLHKAIRSGRLHKAKTIVPEVVSSTKSARSEADSDAEMGYATTRSLERVAAALGVLEAAPIQFEPVVDVPNGGVLLALPALLANGLLNHTRDLYSLPRGFYGIESIFLLLALMALARIKSIEQLRYEAPGEWGKLLGLDRIPEVRTLREKLTLLCNEPGRASRWNTKLAVDWMTADPESAGVFYADSHVRVYHGSLTQLPRHYVARERLCLRSTTDFWINALDGRPFFLVTKEVDPGLVSMLRSELVPWLEKNLPADADQAEGNNDSMEHRFTLVFDREAYSPTFFREMKDKHIAVLTYHKYPGEDWAQEEFVEHQVRLVSGEVVTMKLAERGTQLPGKLWMREVRKLTESGHQTAILSTDYRMDLTALAASMFARWCQENFFKYMREHFNLDRLVEYGTEAVPDTICVVNPVWRKLDGQIRSKSGQLQRQLVAFGELGLEGELTDAGVESYQKRQGALQENIAHLRQEIDQLKEKRKQAPHHITVGELPTEDRFNRLRTEKKRFVDTIKLLAYRAETNMAYLLRQNMSHTDDARSLLQQVYETEVDLQPDLAAKTLTVKLHHLTQAAHDGAISHLIEELNATETIFPSTDLKLVYKLGSCQIPADQGF